VSAQALAEHQRAVAVQLAAEAIAFTDPVGRITDVNRAFMRLHGLRRAQAIPRHSRELAADEESASRYEELEAARSRGQAWSGLVANARRDGTRIELHLTTAPVYDAGGAVAGWIEVGRDIGLERALETQLQHAAKILVADRLAAVVAHDLNNLLTAISGFARLHRETHVDRSEDVSDLDQILGAADRGGALVRRILEFSRRSGVRTVPFDVSLAVREAEPLVRRLLGGGVHVRVESEVVPPVLGDPDRIEEILLNLAANSRDAMPHGGTFSVRVSTITRAETAGRRDGSRSGRYVVLTVSDTGDGMDEATRARIFEPFFTTKASGKGTGLGLASVCSIVREARGLIEVDSAPGSGTTFRIFFPAAVAASGGHGQPARPRRRQSPSNERPPAPSTESSVRAPVRPSGMERVAAPSTYLARVAEINALAMGLSGREPSRADAG
jgi:two-component system cell cycle sensor histidine kinase/response regulator CckA